MTQLPPVIVATGSYLAKVNPALVFPPSARVASDLTVSGAGSAGANGQYAYDLAQWVKGTYLIAKAPNWKLTNGALVLYTAPATEFPWEATWVVGPDGTAAAPTVAEVVL